MMLLTVLLYFIIGVYLDLVFPSEYGTSRHPLFFLGFTKHTSVSSSHNGDGDEDREQHSIALDGSNSHIEPELDDKNGTTPTAYLHDVHKSYWAKGKKVPAVRGVSLKFHQGRVHVLLGHNGAGKTTAVHTLTGFLPADRGTCHKAQHIGFCPQDNILWKQLTVLDHLKFYCVLKRAEWAQVEVLVDALLLRPRLKSHVKTLSGGEKRKLSVVLALMGDVDLVVLDEPTSGMDVDARQMMWKLIRDAKRNCAVLLCTHYMDEADALADRITLLHHGRVYAAGTPLFLKSKLDTGYRIQLVHSESKMSPAVNSFMCQSGFETIDVAGSVSTHKVGPSVTMEHLCETLEALEKQAIGFGVRTFSLSLTSMEDVFVRIALEGEEPVEEEDGASVQYESQKLVPVRSSRNYQSEEESDGERATYAIASTDPSSSSPSLEISSFRHLKLMLYKRLCCARRDRRMWCYQAVLPVIFLSLALLILLIHPPNQPAIVMSNALYKNGRSEVLYSDGSFDHLARNLPNQYQTRRVSSAGKSPVTQLSDTLLDEYYKHKGVDRWISFASAGVINVSSAVVVLHNASATHALPQGLAALHSAALSSATPEGSKAPREFTIVNHPLPMSKHEQEFVDSMELIVSGIFVLIPFTFIPAQYVATIVREREVRATHLQWLAGASMPTYWLGAALSDFFAFLITEAFTIGVFIIFRRDEFVGDMETFFATVSLFTLYIFTMIPAAYIVSFAFESATAAQTICMQGNFFCGFILVIAAQILSAVRTTTKISSTLMQYYRIIPTYCLGEGIIVLTGRSLSSILLGYTPGPFDRLTPNDYYYYPLFGGVGTSLIYMGVAAPVLWVLLLIVQHFKWTSKFRRVSVTDEDRAGGTVNEDQSVQAERELVEQNDGRPGDVLTLQRAWKVYTGSKRIVAVKDLSFGVRPGEILALLGCNGAGKTSTMAMVTQEAIADSGRIIVGADDLGAVPTAVRRYVAYCPQFDALIDEMSVDEHLRLFCGLRGVVAGSPLDKMVDSLVSEFNLGRYRSLAAKALSGGNRRKLSTAIALCGYPKVLLLDEPTTGMDPVARRAMWSVLRRVTRAIPVILTTHHLEEVEAVAHRVAVLSHGELRAIGNLPDLKHAYGNGYEAKIHCLSRETKETVLRALRDAFPHEVVEDSGPCTLSASFGMEIALTAALRFLLQQQAIKNVEDFGITQCSMEGVFLRIARSTIGESEAE